MDGCGATASGSCRCTAASLHGRRQAPLLRRREHRSGRRRRRASSRRNSARAQKLGIDIRYGTALIGLVQRDDRVITGVKVRSQQGYSEIATKSVILACGGFESNPEMRVRYLGPRLGPVPGARHSPQHGRRDFAALAIGARPYGNWSSCHACEWDISAPPYGDRWVLDNFQKHSYPLGIMVNTNCKRFVDEGEDYRNLTYAKFGREIMSQPRRTAIQIFDQQDVCRCCATSTASSR